MSPWHHDGDECKSASPRGGVMKSEGGPVSEPRVTVHPVATREEARALAEELANFPHGIFSMRIVAESADGSVAGYIVRSR
jgi:hypothetical protein